MGRIKLVPSGAQGSTNDLSGFKNFQFTNTEWRTEEKGLPLERENYG